MASRFAPGDRLFLIAEKPGAGLLPVPRGGARPRSAHCAARSRMQTSRVAMIISTTSTSTRTSRQSSAPPRTPSARPRHGPLPSLARVVSETSESGLLCRCRQHGLRRRGAGPSASSPRIVECAAGEWMPEHHLMAARKIEEYSNRSIPIVSLMDTPGAAADADANRGQPGAQHLAS